MFKALAKARKIAADAHGRLIVARHLDAAAARGIYAKKKDSTGELFIYSDIGASFWGDGITAQDVADKLSGDLKGVKDLHVYVNSYGGDVFEGKAILNQLRRFDGAVTVHIDGIAASAATVVAMAASPGRLLMADNATMMIHEASSFAVGNAGDMREVADILDKENGAIADIYAHRSGLPAPTYWTPGANGATGLMADETWMNAEEALAAKLIDKIEVPDAEKDDGDEAVAAALKVPALAAAQDTQRRIAMNRARAETARHSVLQDRGRASPARAPERPAARST